MPSPKHGSEEDVNARRAPRYDPLLNQWTLDLNAEEAEKEKEKEKEREKGSGSAFEDDDENKKAS